MLTIIVAWTMFQGPQVQFSATGYDIDQQPSL